ncbi:hypothetical protein Pmani_027112 [Petrolisthes manimaculis]|uniref:Uncharacterized protein n=1 Tax=Petrolisthes manimaculis TaxID=1843537 RepID=A0AAE1TX72_9EUCA|nr:hypothetical protein Pmani_027112 [Petrolisthes manimaculis]
MGVAEIDGVKGGFGGVEREGFVGGVEWKVRQGEMYSCGPSSPTQHRKHQPRDVRPFQRNTQKNQEMCGLPKKHTVLITSAELTTKPDLRLDYLWVGQWSGMVEEWWNGWRWMERTRNGDGDGRGGDGGGGGGGMVVEGVEMDGEEEECWWNDMREIKEMK